MRRCLNAKRRRELARDAALRQCIGRMDVARFDQERHRADGGPDRRRWKRCCPSAAGRTASCARRRRCCPDRTPALASAGLAPALASLRTTQWTRPGSSPIACRGAASSPNQRRRAGAGASGSIAISSRWLLGKRADEIAGRALCVRLSEWRPPVLAATPKVASHQARQASSARRATTRWSSAISAGRAASLTDRPRHGCTTRSGRRPRSSCLRGRSEPGRRGRGACLARRGSARRRSRSRSAIRRARR
jgi:hypothetical protein